MFMSKTIKRAMAVILSAATIVSGIGLGTYLTRGGGTAVYAAADFSRPTPNTVFREADPPTMLTYTDMFGDEDMGTRYMGRVWTDKTVFAYGDEASETSSQGGLDVTFDGTTLSGTGTKDVELDDDFLNVFSAMASSQKVNMYPPLPIDLVFVIDMSASMAMQVGMADQASLGEELAHDAYINGSRIKKTVDVVNSMIHSLMEQNPQNRCGVVVFGTTAYTLMPLEHWDKGDTEYIKVSDVCPLPFYKPWFYSGDKFTTNIDAAYTLEVEASYSSEEQEDSDDYTYDQPCNTKVSNGYYNNWTEEDARSNGIDYDSYYKQDDVIYIGSLTSVQSGMYLGYKNLADSDLTSYTATLAGGRKVTVGRVPALVALSDGGTNIVLTDGGSAVEGDVFGKDPKTDARNPGDEWSDVYLPAVSGDSGKGLWTSGHGLNDTWGGGHIIRWMQTWLGMFTSDGILYQADGRGATGQLYGDYGGGNQHFDDQETWPGLHGNETFRFGDVAATPILETLLTAGYMKSAALANYEAGWKKVPAENRPDDGVMSFSIGLDISNSENWVRPRLYGVMEPDKYVRDEVDESDSVFVDGYGDESAYVLEKVYGDLQAFKSKSLGDGDGVAVAQVPVLADEYEEYARNPEVKYWELSVKQLDPGHQYDGRLYISMDDVLGNVYWTDGFFDVTSAGDSLSDAFTVIAKKIQGSAFSPVSGTNSFGADDYVTYADPVGLFLEVKDHAMTVTPDASLSENARPDGDYDMALELFGEMYGLVETCRYNEAKAKEFSVPENGYEVVYDEAEGVYWTNKETALAFMPTTNTDNEERLSKGTVIFYRLDASTSDRQDVARLNPTYYTSEEQEEIRRLYPKLDDPDLITYKLADIRVWVEDTGNYSDPSYGSLMPSDGNYEQLVCVSVPSSALPAYLVTITEGRDEIRYEPNTEASLGYDEKTVMPFRLYYVTGVRDGVMTGDGLDVDITKLPANYIASYKIGADDPVHGRDAAGSVFFRDTHWSDTDYSEFLDGPDEYSIGDAMVSFAPSEGNRYYRFQKHLYLYSTLWKYMADGDTLTDVTSSEGIDKAGWDGVEIAGVYAGQEAAKAALDEDDDGVYVLLDEDRVSERTSDALLGSQHFLIPIEYYKPTGGGKAAFVQRAVSRTGAELGGSALAGPEALGKGLCWYDAEKPEDVKDFDTVGENQSAADAQIAGSYLATKIGMFRIGRMLGDAGAKSPNTTNTAGYYYVPRMDAITGDVDVDVYLGNNGRLAIADTMVAVTKEVLDKDGAPATASDATQESFAYEIVVENHDGVFEAIKLAKHEDHWDALIDHDDFQVVVDDDNYLLAPDGGIAKFNDGGQDYVLKAKSVTGDHTVKLTGYEDRNESGAGHGALIWPALADVDVYSYTEQLDAEPKVEKTEDGAHNTEKWLKEHAPAWETVKPEGGGENDSGYGMENKYAGNFRAIESWKTQQLTFTAVDGHAGLYKAEFSLKSGEGLLFNGIRSGSEYYVTEQMTKAQAAKYRLDHASHHQQESREDFGPGEAVTDDSPVKDVGSPDAKQFSFRDAGTGYAYTLHGDTGAQVECTHWYNGPVPEIEPHKIETTPGDGEAVKIGDGITYEISYQNHYMYPVKITITDQLDEGLDFVSASDGGVYDEGTRTVTWMLENVPANTEDAHVTLTVQVNENAETKHRVDNQASVQAGDNPAIKTEELHNPEGEPHKTETTPGADKPVKTGDHITYEISYVNTTMDTADITIRDPLDEGVTFVSASDNGSYDAASHTVTWKVPGVASCTAGKVTLEVEVNDKADTKHEVENTAYVAVGNNPEQQTETVKNPEGEPHKTEITPGDGVGVKVGDEITYEIRYVNNTEETAEIVIRDPLDEGVTFVSADNNGAYDPETHTVTWTFESVEALQVGTVQLVVRVDEDAEQDHMVENTAYVKVGDNPEQQTETMHNPEGEPHKIETTPGAGRTVQPGDVIRYEISYVNNTAESCKIVVRDPLDTNVGFVSASDGGVYDEVSHTVTWTFDSVDALFDGKVTLDVSVLDSVGNDGVVNTAYVAVGNNPEQQTETIHNPSGGPHKTELTPGDGETVLVGDRITYEITYVNNTEETADIFIRDPLDVGATFVSASDGGEYYDGTRTVTWKVAGVGPGDSGTVQLTVEVNENAKSAHKVDNTAWVTVGNGADQKTETVSNPEGVPEVHKTEVTPGDGESVDVGDKITYEITYENPTPDGMKVVIEDPLDDGLDFVSASDGGVYDSASRTVVWTFDEVPARTGGSVRLVVKVNEKAVSEVVNQARAQFGDMPWLYTETMRNPLNGYGGFTIKKRVTGSDGEKGRAWNFTVLLGEALNGKYGDLVFENGVSKFVLRDGETVSVTGLPAGTTYRISEDDAGVDGYYSSSTGASGSVPDSGMNAAVFTNRRDQPVTGVGSLLIRKRVTGSGDTGREWNFTVTLTESLDGRFGDLTFRDGVATVTIKHGQTARATGLPEGVGYDVTEDEANTDRYETTATGASGTIVSGRTAVADFENYRPEQVEKFGSLTVTKTVTGDGDTKRSWNFTVTVGQDISGNYGGYEFVNGVCKLTLKHGESVVITGLPYGVSYSVHEAEANTDGYKTYTSGSSGSLGETSRAAFENHREPAAPGTGDGGGGWPFLLLLLGCLGGIGGLFLIPVAPDKKQRRRTIHRKTSK